MRKAWCSCILLVLLHTGILIAGRNTRPKKVVRVKIAALLPKDPQRRFAIHRIKPAIAIAMDKLKKENTTINGIKIEVEYADSRCDMSWAINEAFNFYMRKEVNVFFGPCCDYSAAPVARQIKFWNLPMVTAGAMAADFGHKNTYYHLLTRVGTTLNSLTEGVLTMVFHLGWRRVKLLYNPLGYGDITDRYCHLATEALHLSLNRRRRKDPSIVHDYYKFLHLNEMLENLPTEIGLEYAGKCLLVITPGGPFTNTNKLLFQLE